MKNFYQNMAYDSLYKKFFYRLLDLDSDELQYEYFS